MQIQLVYSQRAAGLSKPRLAHELLRRRSDAAHLQLVTLYSGQGGVCPPEELVGRMRPHWQQPVSLLAKWIAGRKLVSFSWRAQLLVPLFQLVRPTMAPSQAIAECSRGLGELVDDEGFAEWFVRPCMWLGNKMPVELLLDQPDAVIRAAELTGIDLRSRRFGDTACARRVTCTS